MAPAYVMKTSILERFQKLGLHQETLHFLATEMSSQLRIYHYYDLIKLPHYQKVKELPKHQQKILIQTLIENRKKVAVENKRTLARLLLPLDVNQEWAIHWSEELKDKLNELNLLYAFLDYAITGLTEANKEAIVSELKKESIQNLSCVIKLRTSAIQEKSRHLLKQRSDP